MGSRVLYGSRSKFIDYRPLKASPLEEVAKKFGFKLDESESTGTKRRKTIVSAENMGLSIIVKGIPREELIRRMDLFFDNLILDIESDGNEGIIVAPYGYQTIPGTFSEVFIGDKVIIKPVPGSKIVEIGNEFGDSGYKEDGLYLNALERKSGLVCVSETRALFSLPDNKSKRGMRVYTVFFAPQKNK